MFMLGDAPQAEVAPTYVKNKLSDARDYATDNYHYRLLMGEYPGKKMMPMLAPVSYTHLGSSAISTLGWQASAMAIMARWRMPPDSW